ncbi:response regulator transcription factor [Kocuria rhizophila]|uniref:response regulator transcription factor n=1 Tax=Kocuria rhizophila TaxID=72000 RepID=UPI001ABE594E|nr:response regulator transcription factor [Kocuria rhizophila]MBO4145996.1 response regulator transcription factor [Kocuria rhizophila]MDN3226698.1 response regulator transcription factor [Kocuria rhizophila]
MTHARSEISLALLNDYPVIVEGLARMLQDHPRLRVVERDSGRLPDHGADVVLYDAFAATERGTAEVARLVAEPRYRKVVVYTWNVSADRVSEALGMGTDGFLSKELSADELAEALVRVHEGQRVVSPEPVREDISLPDWPGRPEGLSAREAEVVGLITQGFTNDQIARNCYLSINSVKSYIRSAYRKMGVERRSQAVLWGVQHGMDPAGGPRRSLSA